MQTCMNTFKINDKVAVKGSQLEGRIVSVSDCLVTVALSCGGSITVDASMLQARAGEDHGKEGQRDSAGRFTAGHAPMPPNPARAAARANARAIRQTMLQELEPYFANVGKYIGQIPKVEKKIDALAKLAPYVLPALSRVEFTENAPRNLNAEQQLEQFRRQQAGKKT